MNNSRALELHCGLELPGMIALLSQRTGQPWEGQSPQPGRFFKMSERNIRK